MALGCKAAQITLVSGERRDRNDSLIGGMTHRRTETTAGWPPPLAESARSPGFEIDTSMAPLSRLEIT